MTDFPKPSTFDGTQIFEPELYPKQKIGRTVNEKQTLGIAGVIHLALCSLVSLKNGVNEAMVFYDSDGNEMRVTKNGHTISEEK